MISDSGLLFGPPCTYIVYCMHMLFRITSVTINVHVGLVEFYLSLNLFLLISLYVWCCMLPIWENTDFQLLTMPIIVCYATNAASK